MFHCQLAHILWIIHLMKQKSMKNVWGDRQIIPSVLLKGLINSPSELIQWPLPPPRESHLLSVCTVILSFSLLLYYLYLNSYSSSYERKIANMGKDFGEEIYNLMLHYFYTVLLWKSTKIPSDIFNNAIRIGPCFYMFHKIMYRYGYQNTSTVLERNRIHATIWRKVIWFFQQLL